jgi:hypothetical protein
VSSTPNPTLEPRSDLVEAALPFLPAGSEIRQAFIGRAAPGFSYFVITYLTGFMSRNKYRCVVVTNDAITVLECTRSSGARGRSRSLDGCRDRPGSAR